MELFKYRKDINEKKIVERIVLLYINKLKFIKLLRIIKIIFQLILLEYLIKMIVLLWTKLVNFSFII